MPVERTSIPGEPLPRPRPFWPRCPAWPAVGVACGDELPPQLETAITAQSKHVNENGCWIRKLDLAPLFTDIQRMTAAQNVPRRLSRKTEDQLSEGGARDGMRSGE